MRALTFILLLITSVALGQKSSDGLIGVYQSVDNGFERYSTIILEKDNRFIYKSGLGGCQVKVSGKWTLINKKLKFINDEEFLNNKTIIYPDLSLVSWKITKIGIKPSKPINGGCLHSDKLYRKQ